MQVLKFGGSSVGSKVALERVVSIVRSALISDRDLVVVVSAFSGVTDQLLSMAKQAATGDSGYMQQLQNLAERHLESIASLISPTAQDSVRGKVNYLLGDLADVLHGTLLVRDVSPKILDSVASFGERLSATVIAELFNSTIEPGTTRFSFVDSRPLVTTDSNFGNARVHRRQSYSRLLEHSKKTDLPWVITGFIASDESNQTTTLGRGGSDYTASLVGAAFGVPEIQIWTDVDGFMSADPRKVPQAILIPQLSYEEAMELSHFGAKVIYPPTLQPAFEKEIPIRILNTFQPRSPGTLIGKSQSVQGRSVTGISSISEVALLTVQGSGMVGVAGIASRLFASLSREKISVILISQASSEHSICFAIEPAYADRAKHCLEAEFSLEISAGQIEPISIERKLSILAVVGENMRSTPGVSGRLFNALGKNGINIKAIAQGSSELNISTVVADEDEQKALRAVHDAFFLSDRSTINIFLLGPGRVGSVLLRQIYEQQASLLQERRLSVCLVGIANSKKYLFSPEGIDLDPVQEIWKSELELKGNEMHVDKFVAELIALNLPNTIVIDCTASTEVAKSYAKLLKANISIVSANKRANSADLASYNELHTAANTSNVRYYYETNVGAGLPVINTLQDLIASGDRVQSIEAVLSGTLSFIFNSIQPESHFSDVVKEAHRLGYTEPDPRDDLCGADVARKLLILAREIGLNFNETDIQVESLVPENCRAASDIDSFFSLLEKNDQAFTNRIAKARAEDKKLCYVASISDNGAQVGLKAISKDHPFFNLSGSDNIISFKTDRYKERPLVVRGPGAGTEVTAAGVFADLLRAASYLS